MSSVILIQLIKPYGFISAVNAKHSVFKPFNKQKMGSPLCDATLTLKQQEKIVNIFFVKQNIFFYKKMYVYHFYQKMHTGLTQRPALNVLVWFSFNVQFNNFSDVSGQSHRFLGIYQSFGNLKVSCSRTLYGGREVEPWTSRS